MRVINKENLIAQLEFKDKDELIALVIKLINFCEAVYLGEEE